MVCLQTKPLTKHKGILKVFKCLMNWTFWHVIVFSQTTEHVGNDKYEGKRQQRGINRRKVALDGFQIRSSKFKTL